MDPRSTPSDTITVFTGKVELGQGLRAAIARIAAEELDVPLEHDPRRDGGHRPRAERGFHGREPVDERGRHRRSGRRRRRRGRTSSSSQPPNSTPRRRRLTVQDGVIAGPDGRTTTYWELFGGRRFGFVIDGGAELKHPEDYRFVGKPGQRPRPRRPVTGTHAVRPGSPASRDALRARRTAPEPGGRASSRSTPRRRVRYRAWSRCLRRQASSAS